MAGLAARILLVGVLLHSGAVDGAVDGEVLAERHTLPSDPAVDLDCIGLVVDLAAPRSLPVLAGMGSLLADRTHPGEVAGSIAAAVAVRKAEADNRPVEEGSHLAVGGSRFVVGGNHPAEADNHLAGTEGNPDRAVVPDCNTTLYRGAPGISSR